MSGLVDFLDKVLHLSREVGSAERGRAVDGGWCNAAQGLIAGLNAARLVQDKESWSPRRDEAYIGVLIDDLITRGTQEPYRMFTSRAEYRLLLREDNADLRLTARGRELGLVNDARWAAFGVKREAIEKESKRLHNTWLRPGQISEAMAQSVLQQPLSKEARLSELLRRPQVSYQSLVRLMGDHEAVQDPVVAEQVEIQAKYAGYIERQRREVERAKRLEERRIPHDFDYETIVGMRKEAQEKLKRFRPATVGQASRIQGVNPADISVLLVYLERR